MFTEQSFIIPSLTGLSETTITEHKKLYAGYVANASSVQEKIKQYATDNTKTYELAELYRRFSFEYNGMRNHECYFSLLSGSTPLTPSSPLEHAITTQWGSYESFIEQFTQLALTRGIGWAFLSWDTYSQTLLIHWVDEQHLGQLQTTHPIIALDMWEHSYVADYQPSGKKRYVTEFLGQINWSVAEKNFAVAVAKNA